MKHRPNAISLRYFHCPECHAVMVAPKKTNVLDKKDHRKRMYCYVCKTERRFIMDDRDTIRI